MQIKKVCLLREYKNNKLIIFIVAGELSGDNLGEGLLKHLKSITNNNIEIYGVGGEKMIFQGLKPIFDIKNLSIMGIFEVITKIPKILKLLAFTKRKIIEINPDLVITIDAPGFNFRLQKSIKELNLKRVHYVAPSVWAWKRYRAKKISKFLDHLFVLYPFEKKYFTVHGLNTTFTGHPIAFDKRYDHNNYYIEPSLKNKSILKIGILPGSRLNEIKKLLPIFIKSAILIKNNYDEVKFYILAAKGFKTKIINLFADTDLEYYITDNQSEKFNLFSSFDFALCASGTVTIELAKAGTPMLVLYKLNYITWYIVKNLAKVKTATILNILLKENFIPELFQDEVNKENIFMITKSYIDDNYIRQSQIKKLSKGISKLKSLHGDPSNIVAKEILKLL
ncbi:MAG: Lipid-A-disaccharide synthase [Alphaproteobacteria bacterium MarineAlpha9_Bin3]|nr:MAG: Lipid-A-disaccharide synthase [Alphaproteobacteria bacterium MarineAlpha9_Bin3]